MTQQHDIEVKVRLDPQGKHVQYTFFVRKRGQYTWQNAGGGYRWE